MTKKYTQLTLAQRYKIEALIKAGKSQTEIALILGVHKSTISRELRRNTPQRGLGAKKYDAKKSEAKTRNRHKLKSKRILFTDDLKTDMRNWIVKKRFSPELIAAQWRRDQKLGASYETIYQFIWHCKFTNQRRNQLTNPYTKV